MAAELKKAVGAVARLEIGSSGEFTVWVDGEKVAEKKSARFPTPEDVVTAVRERMNRPG